MNFFQMLHSPENLYFAWKKAKNLCLRSDGYVDLSELAEFELCLEQKLNDIRSQFEHGTFKLKKLRPLPRPKKFETDKYIDRQYYHIAIEDQVAWIAMVNVLGPMLDPQMPPWSYGNRIYRPAWFDEHEDRRSSLEIGPYRHASGHLYRKFKHSWPLFRRHISLTARMMSKGSSALHLEELDTADQLALASAEKDDLHYLSSNYWPQRSGRMLYHASIDLRQFYPSINKEIIIQRIAKASQSAKLENLIRNMFKFQLNRKGMTASTLANVEPKFESSEIPGIPTGLFVAGFLANVAMLDIDTLVQNRLQANKNVAHFRFVDDHTILAYEFDELCDWIAWYQSLLDNSDLGVTINEEKFEPAGITDWIQIQSNGSASKEEKQKIKEIAIEEAKLDGSNPTKLLTKTLARVSEIAATSIDVLDDDDLRDRLQTLEWLLLADIPDREIRPDTRAAFAAGQIANVAQALVQEHDGLVEKARHLSKLIQKVKKHESANIDTATLHEEIERTKNEVTELSDEQLTEERRHLSRCFRLLLQAFQEFPGKARLFYRIHQFCRVTGHHGLQDIASWLTHLRTEGNADVWANYYVGLSLQLLARGLLPAARTLTSFEALWADKHASINHLEDVTRMDIQTFDVPDSERTWFHQVAIHEFGVTAQLVGILLHEKEEYKELGSKLKNLAKRYTQIKIDMPSIEWKKKTSYAAGVWAHRLESELSLNNLPSELWSKLTSCFEYNLQSDLNAARLYPATYPRKGWEHFVAKGKGFSNSDTGLVREILLKNPSFNLIAGTANKRVAISANKTIGENGKGADTLLGWTEFLRTQCSPFDPRRSEWTALEVVRQLLSPLVDEIEETGQILDRLHPINITIAEHWRTTFEPNKEGSNVGWEEWRQHAKTTTAVNIKPNGSIQDYRFFGVQPDGLKLGRWEMQLNAIGRIFLGLLTLSFEAPSVWNIRGNERAFPLPRSSAFQALAVSSKSLLILEGCLGERSAETRFLTRAPELFGLTLGGSHNDGQFDPPILHDANELMDKIVDAQEILTKNQIAVARNQPRQLIPFRLSDFSLGAEIEEEDHDLA